MGQSDPLGLLGREFIGYLAGCDTGHVDHALAESDDPSHDAVSAALKASVGLLAAIGSNGMAHEISRPGDGGQQTWANRFRYEITGKLEPVPTSEDPLVAPLARLARDLYPSLLLPIEIGRWSNDLPMPLPGLLAGAMAQHPASAEFRAELANDPLAEALTPAGGSAIISFPSGLGSSIDPDLLPLSLLGAAATRARLLRDIFDINGLAEELLALINQLRAIAAGASISLPIAAAVRGVEVEPGAIFDLPWGTLRALSENTLKAVGHIFPAQGCLFITEVEGKALIGTNTGNRPPEVSRSKHRAFSTELDTRLRKMSLALLLAETDTKPPVAALPGQWVAVTPLFGSGWGLGAAIPELASEQPSVLTTSHRTALERSAALVDSHYDSALAIPTRRLVSARLQRHDIEDGLVDAVVALESLFAGSDSGELSFRISAAVAWLIGRSAEERLKVQKELRDLYALRSKILHRGGAGQDVSSERDRTVKLATDAISALLRDHPDLVADENRAKVLIMRGENPT